MAPVQFYHLSVRSLEITLYTLLVKSLKADWRVVVRAESDNRLNNIDDWLWSNPRVGFLPHERAGCDREDQQPILLTTGTGKNNPSCLISIDAAAISRDELRILKKVCILFEDKNPQAIAKARTQWTSLTDAGCKAQYWTDKSGQWELKVETKADDQGK